MIYLLLFLFSLFSFARCDPSVPRVSSLTVLNPESYDSWILSWPSFPSSPAPSIDSFELDVTCSSPLYPPQSFSSISNIPSQPSINFTFPYIPSFAEVQYTFSLISKRSDGLSSDPYVLVLSTPPLLADLRLTRYSQRTDPELYDLTFSWGAMPPSIASDYRGLDVRVYQNSSGLLRTSSDAVNLTSSQLTIRTGAIHAETPYIITARLYMDNGQTSSNRVKPPFVIEIPVLSAPTGAALMNVSSHSLAMRWECRQYVNRYYYLIIIEQSQALFFRTPHFDEHRSVDGLYCWYDYDSLPLIPEGIRFKAFLFPADAFGNSGRPANVSFIGPAAPPPVPSSTGSSGPVEPTGPFDGTPLDDITGFQVTLSQDGRSYTMMWNPVRDAVQYVVSVLNSDRSSALPTGPVTISSTSYEFPIPSGASSFVFSVRAESGVSSNIIHRSSWAASSVGDYFNLCSPPALGSLPTSSVRTAVFVNASIENLAVNRTQFPSDFASIVSMIGVPAASIHCGSITSSWDGLGFWVEFWLSGSDNPPALFWAVQLNASTALGSGSLFDPSRSFYGPYFRSPYPMKVPTYLCTENPQSPYYLPVNQLGLPACPINITRPGNYESSTRVLTLCPRFKAARDDPRQLALDFPIGSIFTSIHFQVPAHTLLFLTGNAGQQRFDEVIANFFEYVLLNRHYIGVASSDLSFVTHCVDVHDYDAFRHSVLVYIVITPDEKSQKSAIDMYRLLYSLLGNDQSQYYDFRHYSYDLLSIVRPLNLINGTDPLYITQAREDAFILCEANGSDSPWRKWREGADSPDCKPKFADPGLSTSAVIGISIGCIIGFALLMVAAVKAYQYKKLRDAESYQFYDGSELSGKA